MKKPALALLAALALVGCVSVDKAAVEEDGSNANPLEYFQYEVWETEIIISGYSNDGPKDVVIPDRINGLPVIRIGFAAFSPLWDLMFTPDGIHTTLTSIIIPEGIIEIEDSAFSGNELTNLVLPKSVIDIGSQAFEANSLTNITIPDGVKVIQSNAFTYNPLQTVTLPGNVDVGNNAFPNRIVEHYNKNGKLAGTYTLDNGIWTCNGVALPLTEEEQAEQQRLAAEKAAREQAKKDRIAQEQAAKATREQAERNRITQEQAQWAPFAARDTWAKGKTQAEIAQYVSGVVEAEFKGVPVDSNKKAQFKQVLTAFFMNPSQNTYNALMLYKFRRVSKEQFEAEGASWEERRKGRLSLADAMEKEGRESEQAGIQAMRRSAQNMLDSHNSLKVPYAYFWTIQALSTDLFNKLLKDNPA
ncbi:MAG: leucine-rich repeat protein [Spirochaetaceae bacterium]|jgi:hypothetical protein|nr:leucine-rich repeat protein [Spirochaetaceae bacterium]